MTRRSNKEAKNKCQHDQQNISEARRFQAPFFFLDSSSWIAFVLSARICGKPTRVFQGSHRMLWLFCLQQLSILYWPICFPLHHPFKSEPFILHEQSLGSSHISIVNSDWWQASNVLGNNSFVAHIISGILWWSPTSALTYLAPT